MSIKLHGKEYIEVKDRVLAALAEDGYTMLSEETFSMGGRAYVRVYIEVKGKQYIGTAECKFNANPKSPDGISPFECGETSALGRALGFAGYGVVESIASADEVARNSDSPVREEPIPLNYTPPAQPTGAINAPVPSKLRKLFAEIGTTIETAQKMTFGEVVALDNLTPEACLRLKQVYDVWKIKFDEKAQKSA